MNFVSSSSQKTWTYSSTFGIFKQLYKVSLSINCGQRMNTNIETVTIFVIIAIFTVACVKSLTSLSMLDSPITEEEAIEISKSSEFVKEGMATYGYFSSGAEYYNSSWVEQMKKGHSRRAYEKVPEGHGIWEVHWAFVVSEERPGGYGVIVFVDAEWGIIVYDGKGIEFH